MIGALDRKVLRDLWRLRALPLAIALVMAAGAATLIRATGAAHPLEETRTAYYERNNFAVVFAQLRRADPETGSARLRQLRLGPRDDAFAIVEDELAGGKQIILYDRVEDTSAVTARES